MLRKMWHHKHLRATRRVRLGAIAVEFALTLPIFLALILGFIECGRALHVAQILSLAAREGARAGVLPKGTNSAITTAATNELSINAIQTTHLTTVVLVNGTAADASTGGTGAAIDVTLTLPFQDVSWLATPLLLGSKNLTGRAVMRHE